MKKNFLAAIATSFILASPLSSHAEEPAEILNVSYDIARELYATINPQFIAHWKEKTGKDIKIKQSHAGSSKQARAIMQGLKADLVTFNQVLDVQILADRGGFVAKDWQKTLANNASPYFSLPAFLVRKDNPKAIKDWNDLIRDDVKLVFPNPKTSGNARYTYLAAYAYALETNNNDDAKAREFVGKLLNNVAVFDTGGRGATTSFVEREIGDVLITFEAEVENIRAKYGKDDYVRVVPSISLLAEFPVAVVEKVAKKRGSLDVSKAYLDYIYSQEGQEIVASFNNRVHHPQVKAKYADKFPDVRLIRVEDVFGGWQQAKDTHFKEGGTLDQVFTKK
ncbi:MAG: thiosulfate ABC transporter substrate-binding protein CysP [Cohaesibacter sp.]|nr:thiosulfate ABC transporter substrate-binding protein CysP [Cohaesibacter sp.]